MLDVEDLHNLRKLPRHAGARSVPRPNRCREPVTGRQKFECVCIGGWSNPVRSDGDGPEQDGSGSYKQGGHQSCNIVTHGHLETYVAEDKTQRACCYPDPPRPEAEHIATVAVVDVLLKQERVDLGVARLGQ